MTWHYLGIPGFNGKLPLHVDGDERAELERIRGLLRDRSAEPLEVLVDIDAEPTRLTVVPALLPWWYVTSSGE